MGVTRCCQVQRRVGATRGNIKGNQGEVTGVVDTFPLVLAVSPFFPEVRG